MMINFKSTFLQLDIRNHQSASLTKCSSIAARYLPRGSLGHHFALWLYGTGFWGEY